MRPRIVVSRCLGFEACRWNGSIISDPFVASLGAHVEFRTVCPEVGAGLGIPRNPIRVVEGEHGPRLYQPADDRDVTDAMERYVDALIPTLGDVDGFILKSRLPSCGIRDVKLHGRDGTSVVTGRAAGLFGTRAKSAFGDVAIEDEGRLRNLRLREHFLTRVFAQARLRKLLNAPTMAGLIGCHAHHKYRLMEYGPAKLRGLGRIVANHEKRPVRDVLECYRAGFAAALAAPPRIPTVVNSLTHMYGYFAKRLNPAEKRLFSEAVENYRAGRVGAMVVLQLIRSWVARFGEPYLAGQAVLDPFPAELVSREDSGKGRSEPY